MKLKIEAEAPAGSIVGCLRPALQAVGIEWSHQYLEGFLGSAFAFSMKEDGGRVIQAGSYEWSYFFEMLEFIQHEHIDVSLTRIEGGSGEPPPATPVALEKHTRAKAEAWDKVRRAIDKGHPVIVWQPMTKEAKDSGIRPLPFLWSLIVGYDEEAGTYDVHHSGGGEFTVRWDSFGHSDAVNWFSVLLFRRQKRSFDTQAANRRAIERAIESSQGQRPGANASTHGLSAYEMWLEAFRKGSVVVHQIRHHADFLIEARGAAAVFLREIEPTMPESARSATRAAATLYEKEVAAMRSLREVCDGEGPDLSRAADILSEALESERAALLKLEDVLAKS